MVSPGKGVPEPETYQEEGSEGESDHIGHEQSDYDNMLADELEFSEDEELEDDGSTTIRNAAQYLAPPTKKGGSYKQYEGKYYEKIARLAPRVNDGRQLKKKMHRIYDQFVKNYKDKGNAFGADL